MFSFLRGSRVPSVKCRECTGVLSINESQGDFSSVCVCMSVCVCCECTLTVGVPLCVRAEVWKRDRESSRSWSRRRRRWWRRRRLVLMPWRWFRVWTTEQQRKLFQFSPTGPVGGFLWAKEKIRSTGENLREMKKQFKRSDFKSSCGCALLLRWREANACVGVNQFACGSLKWHMDF